MGTSSFCCSKSLSRQTTPTKNNIKKKKNLKNIDTNIILNRIPTIIDDGTLSSREILSNRYYINSSNETSETSNKSSKEKLILRNDTSNVQKKNIISSNLKINIKDIIKGEFKGNGKFSSVYCGLNSINGKKYALKYLVNISSEKKKIIINSQNKLLKLNHPNLVKTFQIIENFDFEENNSNNLLLINEFCGGTTLYNLINNFGNLSEDLIKIYILQILKGLEYLHLNNIYHKNLTTKNIFIDSNGLIKISDFLIDGILFGDGKEIYENLIEENKFNGNINYYIPYFYINNIINENNYEINQSFDLFYLGCIIIELSTGKFPWIKNYFNSEKDYINDLLKNQNPPIIPSFLSKSLKELIQILFDQNETNKKNIYQKILNLDIFTNPILEENSKSKIMSGNPSSFTNSVVNGENYGQNLQKNKVTNLLNKNGNPSFSLSCSVPSSNPSKINSSNQNDVDNTKKNYTKKNNSKNLSLCNSVGKENCSIDDGNNKLKLI